MASPLAGFVMLWDVERPETTCSLQASDKWWLQRKHKLVAVENKDASVPKCCSGAS